MARFTRRDLIRASFAGVGAYFLNPIRDASAWLERPLQPEVNPAGETNVTLQPILESICHESIAARVVDDSKNQELMQYKRQFVQGAIDEDKFLLDEDPLESRIIPSLKHFLNPNAPEGKQGLFFGKIQHESAYQRAVKLWERALVR